MRYLLMILFLASTTVATAGKYEKAEFQTSAICDMCKEKIESKLGVTEGVVYSYLNLQNKKLKVKYDPQVISLDQIKTIVSNAGYDAGEIKANKAAYSKLAKCCQKEGECQ